jgi:stearoyl-CoA desaturase (Delta-9 desaturase)
MAGEWVPSAPARPMIRRMKSTRDDLDQIRWANNVPFWAVHVAAVVGVAYLGWSWTGLALALGFYALRMFAITGGYHRYFSHRSYKTSRAFQFVLALLGVTAVQKGPLWWASHHRRHHKYSDQPEDIHSPRQRGFIWSHFMWILVKRHRTADYSNIRDFEKYPEIRWLDRYENLVVLGLIGVFFLIGGPWAVIWGFCVSTVLCWHCTFCINSLTHMFGRRRYETGDDSRNSLALGLITFGEGWHNNHHHYQRSANQGFYWWEIDISYYVLRALSAVGLIWDVHVVPAHVRDQTAAPGRARLDATKVADVDDTPDTAPIRDAA